MTTAYLLNHPEHVEHVLQTNCKNYQKLSSADKSSSSVRKDLFFSENGLVEKQKKLIRPAFKREALDFLSANVFQAMDKRFHDWDADLKDATAFNLSEEMSSVAVQVIAEVFFGASLAESRSRFCSAMNLINEVRLNRVWDVATVSPKPPERDSATYQAALSEVNAIVGSLIEARRKGDTQAADLLSVMLDACDPEDDASMSDSELRDEIAMLVVSGFEATASLLVWTPYFLSENRHVMERVRNEADMILQGRVPTNSMLREMEYTKRVIQEVARLRPSVWWFSRTAIDDDVICGEPIKAGTTVHICQYVLHKLPSEWDAPEHFDPDRFLPEKIAERSRFAYLPFGAGPRVSIGSGLTMLKMQTVLPLIYRKFDIDIMSNHKNEFDEDISIQNMGEMSANIKARLRH